MRKKIRSIWVLLLLLPAGRVISQTRVLDGQIYHLRAGNHPEWSGFPKIFQNKLEIAFESIQNTGEKTICLRQEDVKQNWLIHLNGKDLGRLYTDENAMVIYWAVPAGLLKDGLNSLSIEPKDSAADDILVGNIVLFDRPLQQIMTEGQVEVSVMDGQTGSLLPARITIVNRDGILQTTGGAFTGNLAIRPGYIYTGNGRTSFDLPAGAYTIYANHGIEYGVDSAKFVVEPGRLTRKKLVISRELSTDGWIASDTHIHTLTYSGHGDASVGERVLTIAGEGIDLPVMTDHNVKVDIDSLASAMHLRKYFTPIVGYEYTTPVGHFNVFPTVTSTPVPGYNLSDWNAVAKNLRTDSPEIIILNHARDSHSNFRPFDDKYHISNAGIDLRGWEFPANAMEVVNSGALQTDYMSLYLDWFGMMNRGYRLTPVGSSDSHTVSQKLVGQARTYIRSQNTNPGNIDIKDAVRNFKEGRVSVSFGLLTEMVVDSKYGSGDIVPFSPDDLTIFVRVMGPGWTKADRIVLYANGEKIKEESIINGDKAGVKFSAVWKLPRPKQDVFLVAIAMGPGGNQPFWPIAKPFQPTSPDWTAKVIGSTGAVWIDGDGDGHFTSAYAYAKKLLEVSKGNMEYLMRRLASYDRAVAIQAAAILQEKGLLHYPEVSK